MRRLKIVRGRAEGVEGTPSAGGDGHAQGTPPSRRCQLCLQAPSDPQIVLCRCRSQRINGLPTMHETCWFECAIREVSHLQNNIS